MAARLDLLDGGDRHSPLRLQGACERIRERQPFAADAEELLAVPRCELPEMAPDGGDAQNRDGDANEPGNQRLDLDRISEEHAELHAGERVRNAALCEENRLLQRQEPRQGAEGAHLRQGRRERHRLPRRENRLGQPPPQQSQRADHATLRATPQAERRHH